MAEQQKSKVGVGLNPSIDPFAVAADILLMDKQTKLNMTANLSKFFAITVMIFLRRKLGYRFLKPSQFIGMGLLFATLPYILPTSPWSNAITHGETVENKPMIIFAVLMVVLGLWQRHQRWNDFKKGVLWHSRSEGISRFSFLPLSESLCNRFIDPIVCLIIGTIIMLTVSSYLGKYLMFSGFMLFFFEQAMQETRIEKLLDTLDGFCDSQAISKELEFHATEKPTATLSREETAGIPTGLAPDIEAQINRRKVRQAQSTDNLNDL